MVLSLIGLRGERKHERGEHDTEDNNTNDGNNYLQVHDYFRTNAPSAKIEGTQSPTKIPDDSLKKNHRMIEKQNEMNAATRNRATGVSTCGVRRCINSLLALGAHRAIDSRLYMVLAQASRSTTYMQGTNYWHA